MNKKKLVNIAVVLVVGFVITSCGHDGLRERGRNRVPKVSIPKDIDLNTPFNTYTKYTGTITGTGSGYRSRTITVNVTLLNGVVVPNGVSINHTETQSYGGVIIDELKPKIVIANSFEPIVIDAMSGATMTKNGLIEAAVKIVEQLKPQ